MLGTAAHQVGAVTVAASDTSEIDAIVGALAASVAGGTVGVGVAIGAAIAHNTIDDGLGGQGSVQAFLLSTSLQGTGALGLSATSNETIQAVVIAAAVGVGIGFVGVGAAGAGVETRNDVSVATRAYIDGQHTASIKAASVSATANDTSTITADAGAAVVSAGVGAIGVAVSVGVATAHNTIADDVSAFVTNVDSGSTKLENVAQNDLVTIAPGYPAGKGVAGATYMYLGNAATLDLAHTDYTTGSWKIVGYDTSLPNGPSTKPVSLQNGDRVVITQAALGQPQANGIVGVVYTYIGASNTGSTTTDLIHTDYTDTSKWTASFTTAPTAPGNTTKNVALQTGAVVTISRAASGQPQANGVIGSLYIYVGPSNTGGVTTDLIGTDYTDTTKWLNVGSPAYDTSLPSPRTKAVSLQTGDIVQISQAGPTQPQANGTIGAVYRYVGPSNTGSATTDLIAADYTDTTKWVSAYNNATPHATLQSGDLVLVTQAGQGAVIGDLYRYTASPPTKPEALHTGDLVLISPATPGQPQANGIVGDVYLYKGASDTGNAKTDLIAANYTDPSKWASAYTTVPTVAGNTTKNVALLNGDLVLIDQAVPGQLQANGAIGNIYKYIGPSNTGGTTTDLINTNYTDTTKWQKLGPPTYDTTPAVPTIDLTAANYADTTHWQDLGTPATAATYDTSPSKNAQMHHGDLVVIDGSAPQADGTIGHVYRYEGATQTLNAQTDLIHTDYGSALWTDLGLLAPKFDTSLGTGLQTTSGNVGLSATENGSILARASAAAAAAGVGVLAAGAAGAGADATNVVLNNTNAFIQSSTINAHGNVALGASNTNAITADILAATLSAAGSAFASGAASIGISQARNFIGYDASGNEVGEGVQVRAYSAGSNVTAGGQFSENALSHQTIDAEVGALSVAASLAIAPGGLALSLAGAGAITTNKVAADVEATIPDGGTLGYVVGSMSLSAADTSSITALTGAAAVAFAAGSVADAGAIGAAEATNTISNTVVASISGVTTQLNSAGDVTVNAQETASISADAFAAAFSASFGLGDASSASAAVVLNTISTQTSAFVSGSILLVGGNLLVTANDTSTATAQTNSNAASLGLFSLALGGSVARVTINSNVAAYIDASTVTAAGAITVSASAQPEGSATAIGFNAGILAVGASLATIDVTPHVSATVGGIITAASLSILANVNLPADGHAAASASAQGSVGGLIAIVASDTEVTNNDTATAGISQSQAANFGVATGTVVTVAGAILIVATGNSRQSANSSNSSLGLVAAGAAHSAATAVSNTKATVGSSANVHAGSLQVNAAGADNDYAETTAGIRRRAGGRGRGADHEHACQHHGDRRQRGDGRPDPGRDRRVRDVGLPSVDRQHQGRRQRQGLPVRRRRGRGQQRPLAGDVGDRRHRHGALGRCQRREPPQQAVARHRQHRRRYRRARERGRWHRHHHDRFHHAGQRQRRPARGRQQNQSGHLPAVRLQRSARL